jgi:hypothetical protein
MANTYLTRTPTTENINKLTLSCWVKRGSISNNSQRIFSNPSSEYLFHRFETNDQFRFTIVVDGSETSIRTNRVFRDTSAWYHIVVRWDTTQATEADRIKLWVNGVQETSFNLATYPALNSSSDMFNSGTAFEIGRYSTGNNEYFDGSMSHLHCCSGYAYDASAFGQFDANGVWTINTSPSVTYGTNGFFILKDGNSVTDQSGNGNNFTVAGGTLTNTEDNPSNVFATLDAIQYKTSALTYSNGNNTVSFPGAWVFALSQWGVSSGKWYWEAKVNSGNNANSYYGICAEMVPAGNGFYNNSQNGAIMYAAGDSGDIYIDGSYTASAQTPQNKNTDILGLALDLDSGTKTLKIYKNGTQLTSGGTVNLSSYYNDTLVFPCFSGNSSSASCSFNVNFGNGYFGTTAVSSAGTNASGIGIFEYDVPTGYTALSTKGLNL